ncbi:sensor histidine kinase [Klebsiella pneumoniae]|uniref:sensor histidine kinase n=1 Tax=Klebsiella pneumoniae TaxID=573 RepID=UPI00192BBC60|nr:ATP-binding protein [Klebsiella pneumoniae]MBL4415869.1 HAMP domain-containing protein [Klebsiella pneumoniae]MEB6020924.1 ATP-binding protein [Klebsiella pneumoniae]
MKRKLFMPKSENSSLWNWICRKVISLAVGSIILIAFCMWLRFYIDNKWHEYRMPAEVRAELAELINNPWLNINRYHAIIDQWYGVDYWKPELGITDWLILAVLVLIVMPVIFTLTLRTARPLSKQISALANAAKSVAQGSFGAKVKIPDNLPLELRSLSENFNGMSMQLERYEKELKKSHVAMAHELRSPLTAATGRLQGMIDGIFEPSETQLKMVMQQLNELNRLVEDLHLLKLADAGQLNLSMIPVCLNEIVREKIAWIAPSAEKSGVAIRHNQNMMLNVMADPYRLGQVFLILMDNALRYAAEGGVLEISYDVTPETVSVIFRDEGPAVPDELLEDIFNPFVREEVSRSRHSGGSGLGLSIAQAICEAQEGHIAVEKKEKRGLAFRVSLKRY